MKNRKPKMRTGFGRYRTTGQSIPFIAICIVFLFAVLGFSVDIGNTYAEQRRAVNAANAAAIAGMERYIETSSGTVRDADIKQAVEAALRANGIKLDSGKVRYRAYYLQTNGEPVSGCSEVGTCGANAPVNVGYIQVELSGTVDTFFARVVNQDTFPFGTDSFAMRCPYGSGVYPIAVNQKTLNSDLSFRDPNPSGLPYDDEGNLIFGYLKQGELRGLTWRRLFLRNSANQSDFGWVRWLPEGGSEQDLVTMLNGDGSLARGFQEVNFASGGASRRPVGWQEPAGYPEKPQQLSVGDVIYGNDPFTNNGGVRRLLDGHKIDKNSPTRGTVMILPIFDKATISTDRDAGYLISGFGNFMVAGYGRNGLGDDYIDLIALGNVDHSSACLTAPAQTGVIGLQGDISFLPQWRTSSGEYKPLRFVVVMDVSGSMNWNFDGLGKGGMQCGYTDKENANQRICNSANSAYDVKEERRIHVTRKSLEYLVSLLHIEGNDTQDPNQIGRPYDQMAILTYNNEFINGGTRFQQRDFPTLSMTEFSSDKNTLIKYARESGAFRNWQNYVTVGGTNTAAGLYEASRLLSGNNRITHNGRTYEYKTVVILITDGVANTLFDPDHPTRSGFDNNQADFFPAGSECRCHSLSADLVPPGCAQALNVDEKADCHINSKVGVSPPAGQVHADGKVTANRLVPMTGTRVFNRPITEMIEQANLIKGNGHEIFVVAISQFESLGLSNVASGSQNYISVRHAGDLDGAFKSIFDRSASNMCIPNSMHGMQERIPPGGTFHSGTVYLDPVPSEQYRNGTAITYDTITGKLSYRFDAIPPGQYTVTAELYYTHPDDEDAAPRKYVIQDALNVTLRETKDFGYQKQDIELNLADPICPEL